MRDETKISIGRRKAAQNTQAVSQVRNVPEDQTQRRTGLAPDLLRLILERARSSQRWLQPIIPAANDAGVHQAPPEQESKQCRPAPVMTALLGDRLSEVQALHERIEKERNSSWLYPLPADHLLTLVYYNVYRALIANVAILGLDLDLMVTDDYPSPFTPLSPTASSALRGLPPALQPTPLQLAVAHHPQWDIVPDPVIRNNLLRNGEPSINDVELCMDLIGSEERRRRYEKSNEPAGCIVWGDPWTVDAWEVTEAFVRNYPWLFNGADCIKKSTNAWRESRDEPPLDFVELGVEP